MYDFEEKYDLIYTVCMTAMALKDGLRKDFMKNGIDITIDNFAVLMRLWRQDHLTQQQLCNLTCKNKSNLTRILDLMEKKNMITRTEHPRDRRSFIISLTEDSRLLKEKMIKIAREYGEKIFAGVNEEEMETVQNVFADINCSLMKGVAVINKPE